MTQTTITVPKAHRSYRHEAFLYHGTAEFLAGTVPFVTDGLAAGQPVMVAVAQPRLDLIREALGADGPRVHLVDMAVLGRNPARIIPAWRAFVDECATDGLPARGIGEPIWAGRGSAELAECQLHESLLNVAVDPSTPLWLRCPYDVEALGAAVIDEAHRSHPMLVEADDYRASTVYGGVAHVDAIFGRSLPAPSEVAAELPFGPPDLGALRAFVLAQACAAGVSAEQAGDLAVAIHELAVNSLRYGGRAGHARLWQETGALVCEVSDAGRIGDPMVGRTAPSASQEGGRGVWLANQLCDLVQIRSTPVGTAVRVLTWL
ncbi:MAG: sensor histidine kinase [Actinomycetota bacterium]|nr:sensor histidine kinase [Actinomycetota bacterium]